jgi:hypothetical protein
MPHIPDKAAFQNSLASLPLVTYQAGETVIVGGSKTDQLLILKTTVGFRQETRIQSRGRSATAFWARWKFAMPCIADASRHSAIICRRCHDDRQIGPSGIPPLPAALVESRETVAGPAFTRQAFAA